MIELNFALKGFSSHARRDVSATAGRRSWHRFPMISERYAEYWIMPNQRTQAAAAVAMLAIGFGSSRKIDEIVSILVLP